MHIVCACYSWLWVFVSYLRQHVEKLNLAFGRGDDNYSVISARLANIFTYSIYLWSTGTEYHHANLGYNEQFASLHLVSFRPREEQEAVNDDPLQSTEYVILRRSSALSRAEKHSDSCSRDLSLYESRLPRLRVLKKFSALRSTRTWWSASNLPGLVRHFRSTSMENNPRRRASSFSGTGRRKGIHNLGYQSECDNRWQSVFRVCMVYGVNEPWHLEMTEREREKASHCRVISWSDKKFIQYFIPVKWQANQSTLGGISVKVNHVLWQWKKQLQSRRRKRNIYTLWTLNASTAWQGYPQPFTTPADAYSVHT